MSFIFKLDELEPAIKRYAEAGGDMSVIKPDLREVERLIKKQDYDEAAHAIDRVLDRIRRWNRDQVA